jgi:hypothetical protein
VIAEAQRFIQTQIYSLSAFFNRYSSNGTSLFIALEWVKQNSQRFAPGIFYIFFLNEIN